MPAPTTRHLAAGELGHAGSGGEVVGLGLDAEGVQRHRDEVVLAHDHAHLDQLLLVPLRGQRGPRAVADAAVGVELVGGSEQEGVGGRPARRIGTRRDASDLLVGEPGGQPDRHVLAPLVRRPAEVAGAQDEQLPLAGRQGAAVEQHAAEGRPPLQQPRVVGERGEDVELGAVEGAEPLQQLGGLGVAALSGQRRDAGCHRVIMDCSRCLSGEIVAWRRKHRTDVGPLAMAERPETKSIIVTQAVQDYAVRHSSVAA